VADITLEGLIELKNRSDIVGVEQVTSAAESAPRAAVVDLDAIKQAAGQEFVTVFVHLRRSLGYTPRLAELSDAARQSQRASIISAISEIIKIPRERILRDGSDGLASAIVVLRKDELDKIISDADPRVESIVTNRVAGSPGA